MAKALGIGGIFFKTEKPAELAAWYRKWLSFAQSDGDYVPFPPSEIPDKGFTLWSPFAQDSNYFGIPDQTFMINIMVDDLDEALKQVAAGGARIDEKTEDYEYGRFGWFVDPAGNRVELWQPSATNE